MTWRLSVQGWISLLMLGLVWWFVTTNFGLIAEVARLVFSAYLLSLAIRPLADRLTHWRIPRGITVLAVYIALIGVLVLLGALLIPVISSEVNNLRSESPALIEKSLDRIASNRILGKWVPSVNTVSQDLTQRLDSFVQTFVRTATRVGGFALELFIVLILSYFFVTDAGFGERLVCAWVPQAHQPRVRAVITDLHYRLTRWVWAQIGIAIYFAVVFSIGLAALGVPFAATIGVVGGALEIVPYLGGITAWLLAILSAITINPILVVWITIFYVAVVEIETHIIAPALYGRVTGIHPAIVLVALVVGAKSGGIMGILFAVPASVVIITLLQEIRKTFVPPDDTSSSPVQDLPNP
jgi:predicted PurR-regulated permease PerM